MLKLLSVQDMENLLRKESPFFHPDYIHEQALHLIQTMDERLDKPLATYIASGSRTNFRAGEFSLLGICSLCHGCSYLQAAILMDAYLKDPQSGRAQIMRR